MADVEVNEQKNPLFYHYRRLAPDTGGAGRRRGGLAAEVGLTVTVPQAEALVMTHGAEVPNSAGLAGGLPGSVVNQRFTPSGGTTINLGPKPGSFPITPADLFEVTWQGGGGIGDPLDRDPADVATDLESGFITADEAHRTYGVRFDSSGEPDLAATATVRRAQRAARLGKDVTEVADPAPLDSQVPGLARIGERMVLARDEHTGHMQVRTLDGVVLSTGSTRWRQGAHPFAIELPPTVG